MSSGLSSFSLHPFIALYLSLAPFFSTSASLCVLFNHFHMASSFHRESLPSHWCQQCLDCAALPSEWVSNADIGTACQGYGITLKPVAAKKHEYMSAATHSCKTWYLWFTLNWSLAPFQIKYNVKSLFFCHSFNAGDGQIRTVQINQLIPLLPINCIVTSSWGRFIYVCIYLLSGCMRLLFIYTVLKALI